MCEELTSSVWVLEAFEAGTTEFKQRWSLPGFDDRDAAALLRVEKDSLGGLFDVAPDVVRDLARRFDLDVKTEGFYFLIGPESR